MGCLGNILWFLCGGAISGLSWCLAGCLWCITIVGIPVGMQCFKFAGLSFFPFGKEVRYCLAHCFGITAGIGACGARGRSLRDNYWNSFRIAAF